MYKLIKLTGFFQGTPSCSSVLLNLSQKNKPIKCLHKETTFFPNQHMRNITCKLFFLASIYGLLGLQQAYAATYYVSPTGSDSNNGIALSSPVKTIRNALSKAQSSGDIIYVMTGTYEETVNIGQSGIVLSAYQDNKPVIDGGSALPSRDWGALIYVGGNNNTISGFEVKNSNINGVYKGGFGIQTAGHHNKFSKMNVHHSWEQGVIINGDYNIVEDSKVWQAARKNLASPGSVVWASGMSAARNNSAFALKKGIASYVTFRRNNVFNNWGEGLSCFEADHCIMEDNIVYDNWALNIYLSDATNSLVQRNMIYYSSQPAIPSRNNGRRGITLADEVATVPRSANNTIINNFIYNANFSAFSWTQVTNSGLNNVLIANNTIVDGNFLTGTGGGIVNTNSQIRNNIILGANSAVPSNSGITFSNNNWAMTPSLAATVTDIVGDPQLARTGTTAPGSLTSAYFMLSEGSPVIDAAIQLTNVADDFFGVSRGAAPDIGGHESTTAVDSTAPSTPASLRYTDNLSTKVALAWNASTDNVGVDGYRIYRNGAQIGTSSVTNYADMTVTAGVTYSYTVKAYDAAGNLSASSNSVTVNTPLATSAVNISSYSVGNIGAKSVNIKWSANVPATGVVSYSTVSANAAANDLGLLATVNTSATSQSVKLSGLYNNTVYYYKITVKNGSTTSSTVTSTFKTLIK